MNPSHDQTGATQTVYRGRFAPSPTGPLHMGSLIAATASYLAARKMRGQWFLRIEDIDPPREVPGCTANIIATLEALGFEWDGEILYQSQRMELYHETLEKLRKRGAVYRCSCSRKLIRQTIARHGLKSGIYPGTCRVSPPPAHAETAWRFDATDTVISYTDHLQGHQQIQFGRDQGDFIVWRKCQLPSYQFAVTIDDEAQNITEIVRGCDLLQETAGQHLLRDALNYPRPQTAHIPVLLNKDGVKLSKQTGAKALDVSNAPQQLCAAFTALGMRPESALQHLPTPELWSWAISQWDHKALLNKKTLSP
ncbi:MAG: tRNA glutamyl-Q(34) synthetase GluQRS [Gammaproteobacteria bacterium]|nr:tRNA glutamyl-Q(34) synthetase GluQRS [Gammaproteobacteria bacterium]